MDMSRATLHRLGSLALGVLVAGATYWLEIDAPLASAIGVASAVSSLLLLRITREFPDRTTGEGWRDGRWTAVSIGVANFAALVGVQATPLSSGYQAAVAFLLITVGLSAYVGGSLAEMERDRLRSDRGPTEDPVAGD